jgi:TrfA protein
MTLAQQPTVADRVAEAQAHWSARREALEVEQMFLPGLDSEMRAMPNPVARSSIFAPVARGRKIYHNQTVLVSRSDATITYTGHQLDEGQADAWMQLIYEAKDAPLGTSVVIHRAAFLRSIGRTTSGRDYAWLKLTMIAFTAATIVIETRKPDGARKYLVGDFKAFHMLSEFNFDADSETYTFTIDARWKKLFGGREYALIDWEKRLKIAQGQDMAKALQRLVATSADQVQRYALDWLKGKMQYASPVRKFRKSLTAAMRELEEVGVIAGGRIERSTKGREQAAWTKLPREWH